MELKCWSWNNGNSGLQKFVALRVHISMPPHSLKMLWSCVEWESTNIGWHINVHRVKKNCTHMKCEVKHNGDFPLSIFHLLPPSCFSPLPFSFLFFYPFSSPPPALSPPPLFALYSGHSVWESSVEIVREGAGRELTEILWQWCRKGAYTDSDIHKHCHTLQGR